jgi:hypothetical protein
MVSRPGYHGYKNQIVPRTDADARPSTFLHKRIVCNVTKVHNCIDTVNKPGQSPQECVGKNHVSDDVRTDSKALEVEGIPTEEDSDDVGWNVVVPRGRRSHADHVKRGKETKITFSRKLDYTSIHSAQ